MRKNKRWIPILVIIILIMIASLTGILHYFTFDNLKMHRQIIIGFVTEHRFLSPILFMILYIIISALSLPISVFLSVLGGYLFPQPFSTLYIVIGATIGSTVIFLAAKKAAKDLFNIKTRWMEKIKTGFRENGVNYLFFLRLFPLFPFWFVNLAAAFLGVPLRTFVWTTCLGIIPATFFFTQVGAGLGTLLDTNQVFSIHGIFNREVNIALIGLGLLALTPILIKKIKRKGR